MCSLGGEEKGRVSHRFGFCVQGYYTKGIYIYIYHWMGARADREYTLQL